MTNKKNQKKGNRKNGKNKIPAKFLQKRILGLLREHPDKSYNARQVQEKLRVDNSVDSIRHGLGRLSESGSISERKGGKFQYNLNGPAAGKDVVVEGKVDMTKSGSAYIISDQLEEDVYVPRKKMAGAMDKDRVTVMVTRDKPGKNPEGIVLNILKRANEFVLAHIYQIRNTATAHTLGDHPIGEVEILRQDLEDVEEGDVAVLKITQWPQHPGQKYRARVHSRIGQYNDHELEMLNILFKHGFAFDFPDEVEQEIKAIEDQIDDAELERRRDFRQTPTITIDPEDAKDFDDALSFRFLDNGQREVGIHIADVSHFVRSGSALDKEAFQRATSVYLVGKVAPMLPEKLSNDLCSLKPEVDRLTFSAVFTFDKDFRVVSRWFGKGIIHSDRRFAYEEAQEVLDHRRGPFLEQLTHLDRIAKHLRKKRFKSGSINFDSDEVRFQLDKQGNTVEIYIKERLDAHMLVEELMLLANREVATFIHESSGSGQHIPFVYRIHDEPDEQRLADFALLAKEMGFPFELNNPRSITRSFNKLMELARKREELKLLEPLAIRTMAKAEYSTDNIGHYGLGFNYYTHFTSPIRRYSDVLVHRILDAELGKRNNTALYAQLEEQCKHISRQERAAMEAERESVKFKKAEYLERYIGKEFKGVVSGFIDKGFFVELVDNKCEGLVNFDQFLEPFFVASNRFTAMGKKSGMIIRLGQEVTVRIASADPDKRQVDLELVDA